MRPVTVIAAGVLAVGAAIVPASTARAAADSYTVSVDPGAALPGGTVHVTATDANTDGSPCDSSPYTVTLSYTAVGGDPASADVASGTTDSDFASVDTTFTVPSDAASSDAAGGPATVSVTVSCTDPRTARPHHAAAKPAFTAPAATAPLTISAYQGTIKLSPHYARISQHVTVLLLSCHGGPKDATFTSRGEVQTPVAVDDYAASLNEASGGFAVPEGTTYGRGSVTATCWQTDYHPARLYVYDPSSAGGSSGGGGGEHPTGVPTSTGVVEGNAAHAVTAQPAFTG